MRIKRVLLWVGIAGVGAVALAVGSWVHATSNIEEPDYAVVTSADGNRLEVRDYPALIAAQVTRSGGRDQAVRAGFSPLARYIFARERSGEKIAMTAPVTQQLGEGDAWTVQFIMPASYDMGDLPAPGQGDVALSEIPAQRRAAIRFSGVADDELLAKQEAALRTWLELEGLTPIGAPIYAYYNDPFTPGFLRRNEVLFDLAE